ncbi:unnamed protein product [Linum tenue]|uniref:Diacylglycerol O-acyltransferase n=1 Tax=Linum tenue TaxID=586396 RepID=A0AAV0QU26_9ROSI|nr:unnamed protein product [Linum tenue]
MVGMEEEEEEEQRRPPVSPFGVYFNSSSISLAVLAVLEIEEPINIPHSRLVFLLDTLLLRVHPRFSSVIVTGKDGEQRWKRVEVNLKDHIKTAVFPENRSPEYYEERFSGYLSEISAELFLGNRPLWEIHFVKYPTTNAAGNVVFKIHHAIGDGYSLMAALLSCFKRSDDPSLPLTFPDIRIRRSGDAGGGKKAAVARALASAFNTVSDLWTSFSKTKLLADDLSPVRSGETGVGFRPISAATMAFSLDQIKQIKSKLGMTVNDVVTGTVFLGTRMYMKEMEPGSEDAETTSIVVLNTRMLRSYNSVHDMMMSKATESPWGNHFAFLHVGLPKLESTMARRSLEFLKATQKVIQKKRSSVAVHLNGGLIQLYRKLRGSENLTVTMVSYMGQMRVSIGTEKGFIDPNKLKSCIQRAFDLILNSTC